MCSKEILNDFTTFHGQYAVEILHSFDSQFDGIYQNDANLRTTMKDLAEQDDVCFYRLACTISQKDPPMPISLLRSVFNMDQFEAMTKQMSLENENATECESLLVPTVFIIPEQSFKVVPFEKTDGHRALRHPTLDGRENFCLVYFKPGEGRTYINKCSEYRKALEDGIEICNCRYLLFGASNSQLKSHSYWFYRANSWDEIDEKRKAFGDFSQIKNIGKYAARLGLWFTTSKKTGINLIYTRNEEDFDQLIKQKKTFAMHIKDIENDKYCFTDGCGLISKGLAKLIAERLKYLRKCQDDDIYPSAYQIRVAGCKGLVIIEPESTLDQFYIKIRDSMMKFPSDQWNLEICDKSNASMIDANDIFVREKTQRRLSIVPTQLNNQITVMLSDLGVPDETFFRLQQRWFTDKERPPREKINLLKNKIPLPINECRYMFGCALESKLKPEQCFIRYEVLDETGKSYEPVRFQTVTGPVLVTKNPCPYAGDMRRLEAIDLEELHCLRDVIVFSTQGDRPDFHKIAGSDLDGDQYFVYWGKEIQFDQMIEPLPYETPATPVDAKPASCETIINYYLSMLGPSLYGEIYNLHAVVVDRNLEKHPQRTCQKVAVEMANMFSLAIDAGKTGYSVDQTRLKEIRKLVKENNRMAYPDFLMKGTSYPSESILGRLYRDAEKYLQSNPKLIHTAARDGSTSGPKLPYTSLRFYAKVRTKLNVSPDEIIQELRTALNGKIPQEKTIRQWCEKCQKESELSSEEFFDASETIDE